jgi:hypothetical protein
VFLYYYFVVASLLSIVEICEFMYLVAPANLYHFQLQHFVYGLYISYEGIPMHDSTVKSYNVIFFPS